MKIYEIIFSPTGGTKKVADIISAGVGADSICIDLTDKDFDFASVSFGEEDVCIAALPSYGGEDSPYCRREVKADERESGACDLCRGVWEPRL